MKKYFLMLLGILYLGFAQANTNSEDLKATKPDIRLYTLNCGSISFQDLEDFSDTWHYPHTPSTFADPCFLIKHNDSWVLWDSGLGDKHLGKTVEVKQYKMTYTVPVSLISQLTMLHLTPNDINYLGISHTHFDHTGNAQLFPHATLIMQDAEYQSLFQKNADKNLLKVLKPMQKKLINSNYDVFGDGSVIVIKTPGHTVGHQSLVLRLPKTGVVVLSGDAYHTHEARQYKLVPQFNYNRADSLASMQRIDEIVNNSHGRLVIQHSQEDFNNLPVFPAFLN